ncbi:hypothetical protein PBI_BERNARDO_99 [Mycobacterium phage Bernardo]|uniref:Uncharacterized protein n=1 Tax=Mycobacterium phage Bernardo TaxID=1429903 RepID=V5R919_9CAUD|nr:hypothetical protein X818_gp099 [Mycobacterium phage Bernardo]AHB31776.1 hypothetical protein PBI_BERNARDO_99 [Mycobacterium phage Bernardo]QDK01735.1 hypothetical protein RITA1961_103 [Mycobacterium phage Rita1961]WGH20980.1 hypothetical protein SEA_MMASICARM_103 [Mycobacterium phage MmasiCarm]
MGLINAGVILMVLGAAGFRVALHYPSRAADEACALLVLAGAVSIVIGCMAG